jgi:hypothetical protein
MNQTELAKKLGVTRQLLSAHKKNPLAPKTNSFADWKTFLATIGRDGSAPIDVRRKIAEKRLAILHEQHIAAQRENAKAAGDMVSFQECRRQASEAAATYFAEWERGCRELPPILKGMDEISIFKKLTQRLEEIRETLNRAFDAVGEKTK